ncbi:MAG: (Fe-S)-binding protein [bacterium]|nr:Fe-S oxidoreductase [Deltaproteobacteria bacterium]MCP4907164.1 (Fe-S)-binding protein [bacterium]
MHVAFFVPCYVDQLKPQVGLAALEILRNVGIEPAFPEDQTCCGQAFLTAGEAGRARDLARHFVAVFDQFDCIVTPSGSCAATLRDHLERFAPGSAAARLAANTFELCEFLAAQLCQPAPRSPFPHRVGLHASCHALRGLRLGSPSETRDPPQLDPARTLLARIPELEFVDLDRSDECCGFGGVFAIEEEAVSNRMGLDRLQDHHRGRAEILTSTDVSCLLHLEGLARKREIPIRVMHVAEILAISLADSTPHRSSNGAR